MRRNDADVTLKEGFEKRHVWNEEKKRRKKIS